MPVSSYQINQMMAGQQAMFGNNATYAQQISPMGQARGMAPTYAQPYSPMASPEVQEFNTGMAAAPGMLNAAASYGAPMLMGAGMMMGGRIGSMLDPFTAGMRGFGRGVGWQGGAGISANMGNIARAGVGGIARGVGMASLAALPATAMYGVGKYALGQMAEGAQFGDQTRSWLQNSFRFTNAQSRTGYGFSQPEQTQINRMFQTMGTDEVMSTPGELRSIAMKGGQMGMFRGVQDAREFKQRFTQMKDTLKEIASTFNTTLSEALPFFQEARKQGFWTPQDITRHATQVRQVQANTGMSAQQAQTVMGMGAQMTRSIGGTGKQGAEMMAHSQMMSGAALFGGVVNSQQLQSAGFGSGAEGAQNLGNMLAGASARFARSRVGRWALASMMNKEGTGLDQSQLQRLASGEMGIGEMGSRARRNVSGGRAYNFVLNEGDLRGQLAKAGPGVTLGAVRGLVGNRLHGEGGRDRLVTRRIIQRFMGGTAKQADMMAELARDMPRIMQVQAARSEGALDAQSKQREEQLRNTWEGFKRGIGQWWREKVDLPLKEAGDSFSYSMGKTWQRFTDKLTGTTGRGIGLSPEAVRSMVRSAQTGDMSYITRTTGGRDLFGRELGGQGLFSGTTLGLGAAQQMSRMGFSATGVGQGRGGTLSRMFMPMGYRFSAGDIKQMQSLGRASRGVVGDEEAMSIGFEGAEAMQTAMGGAGAQQLREFMGSSEILALRNSIGGTLSGYGARLGAEDRDKYAGQILQRVRAGRAGGQAQKMFSGLSGRQAMGRLMAMQGSARGKFTGIGGIGGLELQEGQSLREAIEDYDENATEELAWTVSRWNVANTKSGKDQMPAADEQSIEEIQKNPRGEQALRLLARARAAEADGDSDKAEAHKSEARDIMRRLANEGGGLSDGARTLAIRMSDPSDPAAKVLADQGGKKGTALMMKDRAAFDETIKRRRDRMVEQMSPGGMSRLVKAAGGAKGQLGQALNEAMRRDGSGSGGMVTQKEFVSRMTNLARAAAADPEKGREIMNRLREEGLDKTDIGVAVGQAISVGREAEKMGLEDDIAEGGAISGKARKGIRKRLRQLGIDPKEVSRGDVTKLIRGQDVDSVRESLGKKGYDEKHIEEFLEGMKGGMTVDEMREGGVRAAGAGAIKTLSDKVAQRAGLEAGDLNGKLSGRGGSKAIVQQLEVHTQQFRQMNTNLDLIARKEKKTTPQKDKKAV